MVLPQFKYMYSYEISAFYGEKKYEILKNFIRKNAVEDANAFMHNINKGIVYVNV
jgi:hypothetical protein